MEREKDYQQRTEEEETKETITKKSLSKKKIPLHLRPKPRASFTVLLSGTRLIDLDSLEKYHKWQRAKIKAALSKIRTLIIDLSISSIYALNMSVLYFNFL